MNGFIGEFLIMLGALQVGSALRRVAALGVILSAVYMLWMFQRVFYGKVTNDHNKRLPRPVDPRMGDHRPAGRGGDRHGRVPERVPEADGTRPCSASSSASRRTSRCMSNRAAASWPKAPVRHPPATRRTPATVSGHD